MPYARCPVCAEQFHLLVRENIKEWHAARNIQIGEKSSELCIGCSKKLNVYDVVEVIASPSNMPEVAVGDLGTVLMIHELGGSPEGFEVEAVLPNAESKWLGTFQRHHLKYRFDKNKKTQ